MNFPDIMTITVDPDRSFRPRDNYDKAQADKELISETKEQIKQLMEQTGKQLHFWPAADCMGSVMEWIDDYYANSERRDYL